jgi:hypothetical protein
VGKMRKVFCETIKDKKGKRKENKKKRILKQSRPINRRTNKRTYELNPGAKALKTDFLEFCHFCLKTSDFFIKNFQAF